MKIFSKPQPFFTYKISNQQIGQFCKNTVVVFCRTFKYYDVEGETPSIS